MSFILIWDLLTAPDLTIYIKLLQQKHVQLIREHSLFMTSKTFSLTLHLCLHNIYLPAMFHTTLNTLRWRRFVVLWDLFSKAAEVNSFFHPSDQTNHRIIES